MNRQYTLEHYKGLIDKIRTKIPKASITTDIIVGFCGETDEQFARTEQAFKDIRWDMAYLARYSPRRGTTSVRAWQDDVSREEKARRWHALNDVLEECATEYHARMVGETHEVLVEKYNEMTGEAEGRARNNKVVQFPADQQTGPDLIGQVVKVKVTSSQKWTVKGSRSMIDKLGKILKIQLFTDDDLNVRLLFKEWKIGNPFLERRVNNQLCRRSLEKVEAMRRTKRSPQGGLLFFKIISPLSYRRLPLRLQNHCGAVRSTKDSRSFQ